MFALPLRLLGLLRPIMWFAEEVEIEEEGQEFANDMEFPLDKEKEEPPEEKEKEEEKEKKEDKEEDKEKKEKQEISDEELLKKPDNELNKEQLERKNALKTEYENEKKRILETKDEELSEEEKTLKKEFQEQEKKSKQEKDKKSFIDIDNENLSEEDKEQLSPREKAFYYRYHKEKKQRQDIESKYDKLMLEIQELKKIVTPKEEDLIEKILENKEDNDSVTVAEVKEILKKQQEQQTKKPEEKNKDEKIQQLTQAAKEKADRQQREFEQDHPDFKEKMNIFSKALADNPELAVGLFNEAQREDGNVARYVYEKGKKFEKLYGGGDTDKKKDTDTGKNEFDLASRIIQNAKKRKTTAGRGSNAGKGEGYTTEDLEAMETEELASVLNKMSIEEFKKVPRHIRKRALGEE